MVDLPAAIAAAGRACPDRLFTTDGWASGDGTVILLTHSQRLPAHLRDEEEDMLLVRVAPDGQVTTGAYLWFKDEIAAMQPMRGLLSRAVELARGAHPHRIVSEHGWFCEDGTVILTARKPGPPDLPDVLGEPLLVSVSPSGELDAGNYVWFMDRIDAATKVGDWPVEDDDDLA